jgi:hypothetical protein
MASVQNAAESSLYLPLAQRPLEPMHTDADASHAPAGPSRPAKRAATEPAAPAGGSGDPTATAFQAAAAALLQPFQPALKSFNKEARAQTVLYSKALARQFGLAAKQQHLRQLKEAGQLPANLRIAPPAIYGEQMEPVQAAAAAACRQASDAIMDALQAHVEAQSTAAAAAAAAQLTAAPLKVQAVLSTLPLAWQTEPLVLQMQQAAVQGLAFALQQAEAIQQAAAARRQQEATNKAAAAAAAAAGAAPLTAEQQVQRIARAAAAEEVRRQLQAQQQRQPCGRPAPASGAARPAAAQCRQRQQPPGNRPATPRGRQPSQGRPTATPSRPGRPGQPPRPARPAAATPAAAGRQRPGATYANAARGGSRRQLRF